MEAGWKVMEMAWEMMEVAWPGWVAETKDGMKALGWVARVVEEMEAVYSVLDHPRK
jgi:hypothetical protein